MNSFDICLYIAWLDGSTKSGMVDKIRTAHFLNHQ